MYKAILYGNDHTQTYLFPTGAIASPEVMKQKYPAITLEPQLVVLLGKTVQSIQDFSAMRMHYQIDPALSEAEALAAIEDILNNPPAPEEGEPTAEERIAAALEYQVVNSMPNA